MIYEGAGAAAAAAQVTHHIIIDFIYWEISIWILVALQIKAAQQATYALHAVHQVRITLKSFHVLYL